jgi:hypothetical protein
MAIRPGFALIARVFVAAALAAGCKTTSSADLRTDGISASINVSATSGSASNVRVQMSPGDGVTPFDAVKLEGGDALFVQAAGQRKQMGASGSDYEANFGTAAAETPFQVIFDRARPDDVDAPNSTGTLPMPFDIASPRGGTFSQSQDVIMSWSPSGTPDTMTLQIEGSCVEDRSISIPADPGSFTLPLEYETIPSGCLVTLTLHRSRVGVVDSNLNSGSTFTLEQVRTTMFGSQR